MNTFDSFSFSATLTPESVDAFKQLFNSNVPTYSLQYTTLIQNRKHKKNRINKKWAKRYGYSPVIHRYNDVKIVIDN